MIIDLHNKILPDIQYLTKPIKMKNHQQIHMPILVALILLVLLPTSVSQQAQVANFPQILNSIKSGDHKLVSSRLLPGQVTNLTQPFNRTFGSPPIVAIGILIFEVEAGINLGFKVEVGNVTKTEFDSKVTSLTDTNINQLFYTYVAIQSDGRFGLLPLITIDTGTPIVTNSIYTYTHPITPTPSLTPTHTYPTKTFLKDFSLSTLNNDLSLKVTAQLNPSTSSFLITIASNCTIKAVSFYIFWMDQTALEGNHTYYLDPGYAVTEGNGASLVDFGVRPSQFNYYNFLRGANWLAFNTTNQTLFSVGFNTFPFFTYTKFKYAMANLMHWRKRQCTNTNFTFYLQQQLKCYDTCPTGYANNAALKFCQKCDFTCKQCQSDGTTCINCPDNSLRTLNTGACVCPSSYFTDYANKNTTCIACDYTCLTCQLNSINCTSCESTRQLSSNQCPCKPRLFDPSTNTPTCSPCHITCQTCIQTSTTCTSCNPTSNRMLVLTTCLCKSGFSPQSPTSQNCIPNPSLTCQQPCLTCEGSPTKCTGCDPAHNRQLVGQQCVCKSGYGGTGVVCGEVCGDGIRIGHQCDDGNSFGGDGCSADCKVQQDFVCDVSVQPSKCVYKYQYTIKLLSITKNPNENTAVLVFQILPPPPAGTKSHLTMPTDIKVFSQNLQQSLLTLTIQYIQTIPLESMAQLSLSTIPNKLNFTMKSDNGLAFTYYDVGSYLLYTAQSALVWIFIALVWIGLGLLSVMYKGGILVALEFMGLVGIVAVGDMVKGQLQLFYQPLVNLKYVFGYNYQVPGEDGMFAYFNYGLLLLIMPSMIVLTLILLHKKTHYQPLHLQKQTKRYILIELTFLLYILNTILVAYSLCTESHKYPNSVGTALSIASILMGILYMLGGIVLGVWFVRRKDMFQWMKMGIVNKGEVWVMGAWGARVVGVLVFSGLSLGYPNTIYFPFIPILVCALTISMILKCRPYTNNLRPVINQLSTILIYLCYFLIEQVRQAQWTGFAILMLLYVLLVYQCVYVKRNVRRSLVGEEARVELEGKGLGIELDGVQGLGYGVGDWGSVSSKYEEEYYTHHHHTQQNKIDLDFDPRPKQKSIYQSRFATYKKQMDINENGNRNQLSSHRKKILQVENKSAI